ncbi:MAG: response regulator [Desulfuromonadaceae bacterium]|nr:response regulator [Desulfuromonadaceae bacterium]
MSKKLLLADDSVTIQKVIEIIFADKDFKLISAANGDEAYRLAQQERPDLVLADVFMPGMDGYQLCENIKKQEHLAGVPVLLLAGNFEPFDEQRASEAGADGWIAKPFSSQDLIAKVEDVLAKAPTLDSWRSTPSATPAESALNAFAQAAAAPAAPAVPQAAQTTGFGGGTIDDFVFEDLAPAPPVEEPATAVIDPFAQATPSESVAAAAVDERTVLDEPADLEPLEAPAPLEVPSGPVTLRPQFSEPAVQRVAEEEVVPLQAQQIVTEGAYAASPERVATRVAYLSDEQLSEIVERVAGAIIEKLATPIMEQVVWEVVPNLAESMIREEMAKIKQQADEL